MKLLIEFVLGADPNQFLNMVCLVWGFFFPRASPHEVLEGPGDEVGPELFFRGLGMVLVVVRIGIRVSSRKGEVRVD